MNALGTKLIGSCLILALTGLWSPLRATSAEKTAKPSYTTNEEDAAACERHLNKIYAAIQEYQRQNQKLPRWLSELVPDYIRDPKVLVCPFVTKTGNLKQWRAAFANYPVFADPGSCSYGYEFCTEAFVYVPGWTQRIYKERQMQLMGFGVPIVRCFVHRPILNLGFDASIYGSRTEWENNFVISPDYKTTFHSFNANRSQREIVQELIAAGEADRDRRMIDLSDHYNALLLHLGRVDHDGKFLKTYPEGITTINDVPFDIRGIVHLGGKSFPIEFPEKASEIRVDRKCAKIHFLQGTMFAVPTDTKVGQYVVHYDNGLTDEVPIIYGKDVKTRWFDDKQEADPNPKAAWVSPLGAVASGKSLHLYVTTLKTRSADALIKSIDFVSEMSKSAPFLLAITTE